MTQDEKNLKIARTKDTGTDLEFKINVLLAVAVAIFLVLVVGLYTLYIGMTEISMFQHLVAPR